MDSDHLTATTRHLDTLTKVPTGESPDIELSRRPGHHRHDTDYEPKASLYADESKSARSLPKEDEKLEVGTRDLAEGGQAIYDVRSGAPLPPLPDADQERYQLTARAVLVGSTLGAIVGASNIYLGLKTGWTFGSSLFGAIFGFAILKAVSAVLPEKFGGGPFGPRENCTVQTCATSAAGLGIIFVGGVPAIYQLGLLESPKHDLGKWIGFCAVSAFYGMTFALPLRKWYILKLKLVFPSPTATALTIRTLHSTGAAGAAAAKAKIRTLCASFSGALILRVVSQYAPGILWDWHWGWWLHEMGAHSAIAIDNWGWYFEWTPAFLGAGILAGTNASWSFYGGSILAWGCIGPAIIHNGLATGRALGDDVVSYSSMNVNGETAKTNAVSPRYWLLWPGVLMMIVASFTELFCNLYLMGRLIWRQHKEKGEKQALIEDPAKPEDQISWKVWLPLLVGMVIITCVVMARCFGMNVGISILSILLGFLWSFIAVSSSGVTDVNPVSTTAKASQLVVGGISKTYHYPVNANGWAPKAANLNLLAGCIAGAAAAQSADMVGDLKTAHLLGAKPRLMFCAQICGAVVSVFLVPGLFVLFSSAYPCILDAAADTCEFAGPSIAAWRAVAIAVASENGLPLPSSSGYAAIGLSIGSCLLILAKYAFLPEKYWGWVPNPTAVGLAFTLNQTVYGSAMAFSSLVAHFWRIKAPYHYDTYAFALAAGLAAGEGIGGCVNALFTIVGIDGAKYGTSKGCPGNEYCG